MIVTLDSLLNPPSLKPLDGFVVKTQDKRGYLISEISGLSYKAQRIYR